MYEDCQGVNLPPPSFCHERRECAFATGNGKIYISKRSFEFQSKIGGEHKKEMQRRERLCCRCSGGGYSLAAVWWSDEAKCGVGRSHWRRRRIRRSTRRRIWEWWGKGRGVWEFQGGGGYIVNCPFHKASWVTTHSKGLAAFWLKLPWK